MTLLEELKELRDNGSRNVKPGICRPNKRSIKYGGRASGKTMLDHLISELEKQA